MAPRVLGSSTVIGSSVRNLEGEDLGKIHELMIDMERGFVAYAVLTFGGFLGMGNKLFALPWKALGTDTQNGSFVLNVSKERLQKAPGFDKDKWPNMADKGWGVSIHNYYGFNTPS